jgi:activator of 2-hydroxyglutaryl-CoA dehydratase
MDAILSAVGICLGASTVTIVRVGIERAGTERASANLLRPQLLEHYEYPHDGNPKATLIQALKNISWDQVQRVAVTGRKFRQWLNLSTIPEPEAVELAYRHIRPADVHCPAVISAGGETFMVYVLDRSGQIANVLTGNKCAAGTGEFFLQQLRRMDVSLDEAAQWAAGSEPYHVSGRCSVFCKSDCTHATNKGVPRARVTAGLGKMMANKVLELLKKVEHRNLMLTGGTARNQMMVHYLRDAIPGLIVPPEAVYFEALGAALWALENPTRPFPGLEMLFSRQQRRFDTLAPLRQFESLVTFKTIPRDVPQAGDVCLLGLDVGSTTTKAVLLRKEDQALLASVYLRTSGDPVGASRRCYRAMLAQIQERFDVRHLHHRSGGLRFGPPDRRPARPDRRRDQRNHRPCHGFGLLRPRGGHHFRNRRPGRQVHLHHQRRALRLCHERSLFGRHRIVSGRVGPGDPGRAHGANRGRVALNGREPPNFNDQCAAFISSDIKNAIHDGIEPVKIFWPAWSTRSA